MELEMVERVARAIYDDCGGWFDSGQHVTPEDLHDTAKAVIAAMRDPTEVMTRALYYAGANNFAYQSAINAALKDEKIAA